MTDNTPGDSTSAASEPGDGKPAPKPTPRPGPKPGPGPKPSVLSSTVIPVVHPHPPTDPSKFGRIDESGTVWLKTRDGEREIGQWQAGSADEGLHHFARRYDDLSTEVEILETRLSAGTGDPRKMATAAQGLADQLPTAAVIGDVDELSDRLTKLIEGCSKSATEAKEHRAKDRAAAIARKEELAAEAEQIGAESTHWKSAGDRLRAILDEWKTIKGIDRKTDDALWKRYSAARDAFNRRRGAHFAELDRERAGAKSKKEEIIAEAEALQDSTDWGDTSAKFRELLSQWKAAGRAPRDQDDALWARFKAAQDVFFGARNAATSERDAEFAQNAEAKKALLAEAEKLDPATDLDAARRGFRTLRDKWDEIGKVPRDQMNALESRIKQIEKKIRDAEGAQWRRTDPEAQARAEQFASRVAQLEDQAAKAEAAGKDRDAKKLREQAAQWREWAQAAESAVADR